MSRILLVEDETYLAEICRRVLEPLGHTVVIAGSRLEAMSRLAAAERFDALVVDLGLPDGPGMGLINTFYAHRGRGPGVLIITGQVADREHLIGLARNQPVLLKPFNPEDLVAAIARVLPAEPGPEAS